MSREKSVLKMVESAKLKSRLAKRKDSSKELGQVNESDEETIWIKISDQEMIERYGMGAILKGKRGKELIAEVNEKKSCCKSKKVTLADLKSDYEYTAEEVEEIDQKVFERIEKEKKARSNWRRLLTQIQIVRALSTSESTLANRVS